MEGGIPTYWSLQCVGQLEAYSTGKRRSSGDLQKKPDHAGRLSVLCPAVRQDKEQQRVGDDSGRTRHGQSQILIAMPEPPIQRQIQESKRRSRNSGQIGRASCTER